MNLQNPKPERMACTMNIIPSNYFNEQMKALCD
nr:MAG TPA: hypothetical protein [Caudoviricetes sp.]